MREGLGHDPLSGDLYLFLSRNRVRAKGLDHVPLQRQVLIMARHGLEVSSQRLFEQALALAELLRPIYNQLGQQVLEAPVLHAGETCWPRLDARVESLDRVDAHDTADRPLCDLAFKAHVRRKFAEIRENFPTPCTRVLEKIHRLYDVEESVEGPFPGHAEAQRQRAVLRAEQSQLITDEIWAWAWTEVGLPRSELGKAVRYMIKRWPALDSLLEGSSDPSGQQRGRTLAAGSGGGSQSPLRLEVEARDRGRSDLLHAL